MLIYHRSSECMSTTEIVEKYHPNFEGWIQEFQEWQTRIGLILHGLEIIGLKFVLIGIRLE